MNMRFRPHSLRHFVDKLLLRRYDYHICDQLRHICTLSQDKPEVKLFTAEAQSGTAPLFQKYLAALKYIGKIFMKHRKQIQNSPDLPISTPPIGLYEKALPSKYSWEQRLIETNKAGFAFLEMSIDESEGRIARLDWSQVQRRELVYLSQDLDTPIKSLSLSTHRRYSLGSTDQKTRETGMDYLKKSIGFALDLGIRTILLAGCDVYYEESTPQTQDQFINSLTRAVALAESAQIMLALENWDKSIDSLTTVMEYVNLFQSPWFQAYADIGNLAYAGKDVIKELEIAQGHIAALHVKDTLPGQLRFVAPGNGCVPFVQAFRTLKKNKYHGSIVLELWTGDRPNPVELIRNSYNWIRDKLLAAEFTGPERSNTGE